MKDTACLNHCDVPSISCPRATTLFASAERDSTSELRRKVAVFDRVPLLSKALDATAGMVMILNRNRQIVVASRKLLAFLDATVAEVVEKRPGEAFQCIRANEGPGGCGTAESCATCGAVNAVLQSMTTNTQAVRECRILVQAATKSVPLDLRVTASPFEVERDYFILVTIEDISHEKRVAVLQRTFFHDVLNTAGCIKGYADFLIEEGASDLGVCQRLGVLSDQLIDEIGSQRDLLQAETGDLKTKNVPLRPKHVLEELRAQYLNHSIAEERSITILDAWQGPLVTDRLLLKRVLGNMLKNALEATPRGGTVTMACTASDDAVAFRINNTQPMPHDVQLQVFQRSFSTKGESGRGIGTYSMKLFAERYLGGTVDFVSNDTEGTTFRLQLPKQPLAVFTASG